MCSPAAGGTGPATGTATGTTTGTATTGTTPGATAAGVDCSGSRAATISPSEGARLEISGRGDVTLPTTPPRLDTDVTGAGEVHQMSPSTESASPSPSPSPSPTPSPSPPPTPKK